MDTNKTITCSGYAFSEYLNEGLKLNEQFPEEKPWDRRYIIENLIRAYVHDIGCSIRFSEHSANPNGIKYPENPQLRFDVIRKELSSDH